MNNFKKIRVYSFYYKDSVVLIDNEIYIPVMAGNALKSGDTKIIGDDTGESISGKNLLYSEITGIYWVWKNTQQDVTGSCHYRRYFTNHKEPFDYALKRLLYYIPGLHKKRFGLIYTNNINRFKKRILNREEILEILNSYDAILPQPRKLKYSVGKHYQRYHNSKDLKIIEEILAKSYPEYLDSFHKVMNGKRLYANNMFILGKNHFEKFMQWWFFILFEFERQIDTEKYTGYQQRVIGFMGERLLTIWFHHQNLHIKELPVLYFKKLKY